MNDDGANVIFIDQNALMKDQETNLLCRGPQMVHRTWTEEQGFTMVYMALVLPVLIALAGLAIDGSNYFVQQRRMQTAADAAAVGGARILALGGTSTTVNGEVNSLATANGADSVSWTLIENGRGVQVQTTHIFPTYFAGILGYTSLTAHATASAHVFVPGSTDNLLPMATKCDDMSNDEDPAFTFGAVYTLWDNDMNAPGNFGWVDWNGGSVGTAELADNIAHPGNSGVWEVGQWIPAGPGVRNSSSVRTALNGWIGKAVTIPLYDRVTGNGANTRYQICSFAEFILEDYNFSGSNKWVRGTFIRKVIRGGRVGNPPDFGVRDVRLIQ
jgi:Flp pilus assembly protein TadG